jgi:hypothetical protein
MKDRGNVLISHPVFGYANFRYLISFFGITLVLLVLLHDFIGFVPSLLFGIFLFYALCMFFIREILVFPDHIIIRWLVFPYLKKKVIKVFKFKKITFRETGPRLPNRVDILCLDKDGNESFYSFVVSNKQFEKREEIARRFFELGAEVEI